MKIRELNNNECKNIAINYLTHEYCHYHKSEVLTPQDYEVFVEKIRQTNCATYCTEDGKSAVIMTRNHDKFNSQYVSIVFVNEPDRNKGIATALLLHAIEMSPNGVSLHVNADNNIAYNLYRKLGFKPYGMQMPMREIFMATKKGLGGRENW